MLTPKRSVSWRVNLPPAGKGRPRAVSIGGKARLHPDKRTEALEEQIATEIGRLYSGDTFKGPIGVKIVAVIGRPQTMFRASDELGRVPATVKPDVDNVAKLVLDAMQRCRSCGKGKHHCQCGGFSPLLADDASVVRLVVAKWRAAVANRTLKIAEQPHFTVRVEEYEG